VEGVLICFAKGCPRKHHILVIGVMHGVSSTAVSAGHWRHGRRVGCAIGRPCAVICEEACCLAAHWEYSFVTRRFETLPSCRLQEMLSAACAVGNDYKSHNKGDSSRSNCKKNSHQHQRVLPQLPYPCIPSPWIMSLPATVTWLQSPQPPQPHRRPPTTLSAIKHHHRAPKINNQGWTDTLPHCKPVVTCPGHSGPFMLYTCVRVLLRQAP
jgi:hypothetical protein